MLRFRVFDRCIATSLLFATAPLLLGIAILIKATSRGPILFRQERIGLNGVPFTINKFRTMHVNAEREIVDLLSRDVLLQREWASRHKLAHDPRVTRVGRVLRSSGLDELPQLYNVASGDMSLVGPRPIVSDEVPRYGEAMPRVLSVRPGMTGLWQVSERSSLSYPERVALDLQYVARRSLRMNLRILARTLPTLLGQGAGRVR